MKGSLSSHRVLANLPNLISRQSHLLSLLDQTHHNILRALPPALSNSPPSLSSSVVVASSSASLLSLFSSPSSPSSTKFSSLSKTGTRKMASSSSSSPSSSSSSLFAGVQQGPPDPILGVAEAYRACTDPKKVDLGVGAYRTNEGKPYVFNAVKKAEEMLAKDETRNKEYLPIDGLASIKKPTQYLVFGKDASAVVEDRICSLQVLSGTGGLRVAAEFIRTNLPNTPKGVLMSNPTWGNHKQIFEKSGFEVKEYPYWKAEILGIDIPGMLKCIEDAPSGSVVLLHACAHNPTGMDPTEAEWKEVMEVIKRKNHLALLDCAYQGFASGSLDKDAFAIRLFEKEKINFIVTQSFAKNLGLYGERIGMLHLVCGDKDERARVMSQVKRIARPMYSNPALHGAQIVEKVLGDSAALADWQRELKGVADRILAMRERLTANLKKKETPGDWSHITRQIGMFSYTGLTPKQCERMTEKWCIFMVKNGRISLAGMNDGNVDYVADAIDDCVRNA